MGERGHDDRRVEVIRRRIVDDVDIWIARERFVAGIGFRYAEGIGLAARRLLGAAGDGDDIDKAEPPHRIDVMRTDKTRADEAHSDPASPHASACLAYAKQVFTSSTGPAVPRCSYST